MPEAGPLQSSIGAFWPTGQATAQEASSSGQAAAQQPIAGEPMETSAAPAEASAQPMETSEASPALQVDPTGASEPGIGPVSAAQNTLAAQTHLCSLLQSHACLQGLACAMLYTEAISSLSGSGRGHARPGKIIPAAV